MHDGGCACRGVIGMGLVAKGSSAVNWHAKGEPGKFPIEGANPQLP